MAKQIKNRREDLYINEVPPEILDKTSLETALSTDGFVTNTDYATQNTGGVVRVSPSNGINIGGTGILTGVPRTVEQYDAASTTLLISKGTLETVLLNVLKRLFIESVAAWGSLEVGSALTFSIVKDDDDGASHWQYDVTAP